VFFPLFSFTAPNKSIVTELGKIQLVCTGNSSTISQAGLKGSLDYLRENPSEMQRVWNYYYDRTSLVVSRFQKLSVKYNLGTIANGASATFYVWANFGGLPRVPGLSTHDLELAVFFRGLYTSKETNYCGVAAVPGSAFEVPGETLKLRFSCACDNIKDLEAAMNAIEYGVQYICSHLSK
jgi:aspartate/methionine/tyrosine aminotransferase